MSLLETIKEQAKGNPINRHEYRKNKVAVDTGDPLALSSDEIQAEWSEYGRLLESLTPGARLEVQSKLREDNRHAIHSERRQEKMLQALGKACDFLGVIPNYGNIASICDEVHDSLKWLGDRDKLGYAEHTIPPIKLTLRGGFERECRGLEVDWSYAALEDCVGDTCEKNSNCWQGAFGSWRRCTQAKVEKYLHIPTGFIVGFESAVSAIDDVLRKHYSEMYEEISKKIGGEVAVENLRLKREIKSLQSELGSIKQRINRAHLYMMQDNRNGRIKIGYSKNPKVREKTLQSEVPDVWMVFSTKEIEGSEFVCYKEAEKALHKHFADKRVRGEWFDLSEDDIAYVKTFVKGYTQEESVA